MYNIRWFCTIVDICWFRCHIIIAQSTVMGYLKFNTESFMIINKPMFVTRDKFSSGFVSLYLDAPSLHRGPTTC